MGYDASWIAIPVGHYEAALRTLRLAKTGTFEDVPDAPISLLITSGWAIIVENGMPPEILTIPAIKKLSAFSEVIASSIDEHVMKSKSAAWSGGLKSWEIAHDSNRGTKNIKTFGTIPNFTKEITSSLRIDAFDKPLEVAEKLAGFRIDRAKGVHFETLDPSASGKKRTPDLLIKAALRDLGFESKGAAKFSTRWYGNDIEAMFSWQTTVRMVYTHVIPNVCIRSRALAELLEELTEGEANRVRGSQGWAFATLGWLSQCSTTIPKSYLYDPSVSMKAIAEDVVADFQSYGLPFIHQNSSLRHILSENSNRIRLRMVDRYLIPAGRYLLGDREDTLRILNAELALIADGTHQLDIDYRRFAQRLRDRCNHD